MSKKKSPGPAIVRGMKQMHDAVKERGALPIRTWYASRGALELQDVAILNRSRSLPDRVHGPDAVIKVVVSELGHHPAAAAIERVREYCEELKLSFDGTIGARDNPSCVVARDILSLLPPAKGTKR